MPRVHREYGTVVELEHILKRGQTPDLHIYYCQTYIYIVEL